MMIHLNTLIANRNSIILLKIKVCFHISVVEIVKRWFSLCDEYFKNKRDLPKVEVYF